MCNIKKIVSTFEFLCSGDLISKIDGKSVRGVRDVLDAIGLEVGRTLDVELIRQPENVLNVKVTLAPEYDRRL